MKKIATLLVFTLFVTAARSQVFDTTGIGNWPVLTNSYNTWMQGAFEANRDTSDPYDFGWGFYDITTHLITGDSIYILKTVAGNYKAISIDLISSGVYTVTFSNLDGSNKVTKNFNRSPYGTKNFFQYSIDNDQVKDLEAATASWDIVFTKYLTYFPGFGGYPVAGALSNAGTEVSQVEFTSGGSYSLSDTSFFPFSTDISTIGYDWKSAGQSGTVVHDTLVYFVKDQAGNINELKFSGYGGSGTGKMVFEVNGQADSIVLGTGNTDQVYYSLQNKAKVSTNQDNDWDVAFYAQSSFSSIPVRVNDVNGVELYVYPNADINYWNAVGVEEYEINLLSVYPNPTRDLIHIALQAEAASELNTRITDQSGRMVKSQSFSAVAGVTETQMDVSDLKPGIYLVQLSGQGIQASTRLVITP